MLNHGVPRTLLGNSDSHGTYDTEPGIPQNYIRSDANQPPQIDPDEIAAQIHAMRTFATFGPFIDFTIDGKGLGETIAQTTPTKVTLAIKAQSPT